MAPAESPARVPGRSGRSHSRRGVRSKTASSLWDLRSPLRRDSDRAPGLRARPHLGQRVHMAGLRSEEASKPGRHAPRTCVRHAPRVPAPAALLDPPPRRRDLASTRAPACARWRAGRLELRATAGARRSSASGRALSTASGVLCELCRRRRERRARAARRPSCTRAERGHCACAAALWYPAAPWIPSRRVDDRPPPRGGLRVPRGHRQPRGVHRPLPRRTGG